MNSVATVSQISGEAYVERNGQKVALQQGDPVFVADTVLTSADSKLELHFADDAVISLGASTKIAVQDFAFDPQGKTPPSFALEMLDGLVRSVSGKVVEQNPEAFKLSSPLGTVGIRGTETLHHITMKYEVHTVVNMETGHTVVITTPDGRQVIIAESLRGVTIFQDNPGPLNPYHVNPNEIEEVLKKTYANDEQGARPLNGFFVLADAAFLSATGANHVEGGPAFVSGAQIQNLFGALNNFMTSLGYSGLSNSMGQFGSGLTNYSDYSGSIVGSIGRMLAYGNDWSWSNNTLGSDAYVNPFPVTPVIPVPPVTPVDTPINMDIALKEGPYYFDYGNKVMENDPFGIQCQVNLSNPTTGKPIILEIGGTAQANIHYDQTIGVGNVITNWGVFESGASMAPSPASMFAAFSAFSGDMPIEGAYITWLGDGKIAIHLPPGVNSFFFKVPLIDTDGMTTTHTFEYKVLSGGGYDVTGGATGKITIVPDEIAEKEGWEPPKPTDPDYENFITDPNRPGPKGPVVWLGQDSNTVLENAEHTYTLHLDGRNPSATTLGSATTITLELTDANGDPISDLKATDLITSLTSQGLGITASYNAAKGELTITLPASFPINAAGTTTTLNFSAGLTPDSTVETGNDSEKIIVSVKSVEGGEASHSNADVETDIIDIPTVSVEAGATSFSEDGGEVTFTFSLTSPMPNSLPVGLSWSGAALNGCTLPDGSTLPTSITFAPGQTSYSITVKGKNDALNTGNQALDVTIKPEGGTADTTDNYHVSTTDGSAAATRVDDTPAGYDGPLVRLVAGTGDVSTNGDDRHAVVNEDGPAANTNGGITFTVELVDRANTSLAYSAQEEITVTLTLGNKGGATYGTDYKLDMAAILAIDSAATFNPVTGKLIIHLPAGTTNFSLPVITLSDALKESGEGFTLKIDSVAGNESTVLQSKDTVETDIADGETLVSLNSTSPAVVNEGSNVTGTITLDKTFAEPVVVTLKLDDGAGNITYHNVTVPANSTTASYSLPTANTNKQEGSRSYSVSMSKTETTSGVAVEAASNPTNGTATGTLQDVLNGPVFSLSGGTATVSENVGKVAFTISLSKATVEPVDIVLNFTGSGTATYGVDYKWPASNPNGIPTAAELGLPASVSVVGMNPASGELTLRVPEGFSGNMTVKAAVINDIKAEANETFGVTLNLATPSAAAPGSEATVSTTNKTATVTIEDDMSGPRISVSAATSVSESAGTTPVTVTLNGTPAEPILLELELSSTGTNGAVIGTDVKWPTAAAIETALEARFGGTFDFTVQDLGGGKVTILVPAGFDQGSLTINAILTDNNITAPNKNFSVSVAIDTTNAAAPGSEATISGTGTANVTLAEDLPAQMDGPQLTLGVVSGDISSPQVAGNAKVQEDAGSTDGKIVFSLDIHERDHLGTPATTTEEITVVLQVTPKGLATYGTSGDFYIDVAAMGIDGITATYNASTKELTLTIPSGYNLGSVDIPVVIVSDHIGETGEGFTLEITSVEGNEASAVSGSDSISTDIQDDSILASISAPTAITEDGTYTATVSLTGAPGTNVTVVVEFDDGVNTWQESVTFGSTDITKSITFTPENDQKTESRAYSVKIVSITTTGEIAIDPDKDQVDGTVTDLVDGPVFSLNVGGAATATKSEDAGSVNITVNVNGTTAEAVDVVLSVSGTATYGVDYKWPASDPSGVPTAAELGLPSGFQVMGLNTTTGQLTIRVPAGASGDFTVKATIINDTLTEGPGQNGQENFAVTLSLGTASSAAPGSEATVSTTNKTATVTIEDDNNGPEISITAGTTSVLENVGSTPITVTVGSTPTEAIDLVLTLSGSGGNGAGIGTDVKWPDATALQTYLNATYPSAGLTVQGVNNSTGTATIRVPAGFTLGNFTINATIVDNALNEASKQFTVSVSISTSTGAPGSEATIDTGTTAPITINEDTAHLDGPTVQLVLCDSSGNPLTDTAANAIAENGGKVYYSLNVLNANGTPYTGAREAITVSLNVTGGAGTVLNGGSTDITFANGTGGTGWTYNPVSGTISVTIPANTNKITFSGTAKADTAIEGNETVAVAINTVTGNEALVDNSHKSTTTTIQDVPTVSVEAGKLYYSEGASPSMDFTFTLTSPALVDTVIYFTCTPGAGLGLTDFTGLTGWPTSITILKGQTSATLSLPINNDALTENNEALTITLNAQSNVNGNYHLGSAASKTATSTIVDDTQEWNEGTYGPKPNGHGEGQAGAPIVRLTAGGAGSGNLNHDGSIDGDPKHAVVNEDNISAQGGTINYKLELVNASGQPQAAVEAVTVVIDITTIGGAAYGSGGDFTFDLVALRALAGVTSANYDTNTHKLTLVLAAGTTSVNIPVNIVPDQLTEKGRQQYDDLGQPISGTQEDDEAFTLKISSVNGAEASVDTAKDEVNTTIDEVTQGIQVSLFQISGFQNGTENSVPGQGFIKIGLKLSQASDEPVVVLLKQTQGDGSFTTLRFVIDPSDGANLVEFEVPIANNQRGGGNGTGTEGYTLELEKVIGGEASIDTNRTSVSGTITDNMDGPKISIVADQPDVHESEPNTTAPDGTTSAEFTVKVDGVPTEPIDITLNINLTDDAKWLSDAELTTLLAGQGCEFKGRTGGQLTVRVPAGFGNVGSNTFTVKLNIVDDNLTEGSETLTVSLGIVRSAEAPGSEATIKSVAEGKASTTIIDDSKDDSNQDGPFLHLLGTRFVSESGATPGTESYARYQVVLRNAAGEPVTATETITMRLTYTELTGMGLGAMANQDYELLDSQYVITIQAGQSVSNIIAIRIADDRLTENNEGFEVAINPATVTGGEARIANTDDVKVKTTIVDDTKAWPDTTGQVPNDGFGFNEVGKGTHSASQLDGPKVTLTGSYWVAEPGEGTTNATLDFTLNLDAAPEEPVTVTVSLKAAGADFSLLDLFGTEDITAINTKLAGSGVSNFRVNPAGGWLFDVTVPTNNTAATFKLPLQPDDLSETDCKFTTSIVSVAGSEARIGSGSSLTTTITDEDPSTGPSITLKVLDYDGTTTVPIDNETGNWEQNASLPSSYTPGDKPANFVYFSISSSRAVAEETTVTFKLYNLDGSVITTDKGITGGIWNEATHSYTVKIPKDASTAEFKFTRTPGEADYYRVQLTDTDNSESVLGDSGQCVSEVQQYTSGGTTHKPTVSVSKVDGTDPGDTATGTREGENATFKLHVNETTTEAITVTMKISGISTGFSLEDMASANGLNMTWQNKANGTFTVTIPADTGARDILFTLPIVIDAVYEGKEGYMVSIINTGGAAWAGGTSAKAEIIDSIDAPTLSLEDANTAGTAVEGGNATYRLVLDKQPFGNITVTLKYTPDAGTLEGQDYSPVKHLNIVATDWVEQDGKWYYVVNVPLPDDQVEGDKGFKVEIENVTGDVTVDDAHKTVDTDITDNLNGPTLNFVETTATIDESGENGDAKFELTLTRPAAQEVTVTLKITGTAEAEKDYDLSLLPSGYTVTDTLNGVSGTYITFKIPQGQLKAVLDLNDIFTNDKLTEGDETIKLEIVDITGGEVQKGTSDTATVTIEDTIDGGEVQLSVNTSTVNESLVGEGTTDKFTFTFTLDAPPEQDVTIWFTFQGVTDNILAHGPFSITITEASGLNYGTYEVPYSWLVNDHKDEQPSTQFKLVITDIHGNETLGKDKEIAVTVQDDDHKPIAVDDAIVVLVPPAPGTLSWRIDVLANDSPEDAGDLLRSLQKSGAGKYGTFSIDNEGYLTYTLDGTNESVKKLTTNQSLTEDAFNFNIADTNIRGINGEIWNQVASKATLEIKTAAKYTGTAKDQWIMGSAQAEDIDGGGGVDKIHAGAGNDTLRVHAGGKGFYYGEDGNDLFVLPTANLVPDAWGTIDGGVGNDTLALATTDSGKTLDFTGWTKANITSVEVLDITGGGDNTLKLDGASLASLNDQAGAGAPLRVNGNSGDMLALADFPAAWENAGTDGDYFALEHTNGEIVLVHKDLALVVESDNASIDVSTWPGTGNFVITGGAGSNTITTGTGGKDIVNAGAGDDVIILRDSGTPNGTFDKNDIGKVDGGTGNDTLRFAGAAGLVIDFTTGLNANINNVEVLDLSQSAGSILRLNGAAFNALVATATGNKLYVEGGNTLELCNTTVNTFANWQYASTDGDYYVLQWGADASKQLYVHNSVTLSIKGGATVDTMNFAGYPGALTIDSGDGNDIITAGNGVNTITAGLGNDVITGGTGSGTYNGGTGNDTITGGTGSEAINGDDGADVLRGGGGADTIHGGAGTDTLYNDSAQEALFGDTDNDTFILHSLTNSTTVTKADFGTIDGGAGTDVLKLAADNMALDLSGLGTGKIEGIETVSLTGTGANRLILDENTLTEMGVANGDKITVAGEAGDTFVLQGTGWTFEGLSGSNLRYKDATGRFVEVASTMTRVVTDGADAAFAVTDRDIDETITATEIGTITGTPGLSTLTLESSQTEDKTLDLSGLTAGTVTGIDTIKLEGFGSNKVVIGENTLANMGLIGNTLTVEGDTGDTFMLQGAWAFDAVAGGYVTYKLNAGTPNEVTLKVSSSMNQLYQGTGNADTFVLVDKDGLGTIDGNDFASITGGVATDTLMLAGTGLTLNLASLGSDTIKEVEVIDLSGAGNKLILGDNTITSMGLTSLTVNGTFENSFELHGSGWNYTGLDNGYHTYSNGSQTLRVQEDLTRAQEGTSASESFAIIDTDTIGGITAADFAYIHAGGGDDTLRIDAHTSQDDKFLDLTNLGAGQISGIATIDLTGNGNNKLVVDENTMTSMGVDTLTVKGNAGDTFELKGGGWTYQWADTDGQLFQDANGKSLIVGNDMLMATAPGTTTNTTGSDFLQGTENDDTFTLKALNTTTTFLGVDFGKIDGGNGEDSITFEGNYSWINLSGMTPGKIINIEGIDLRNHGANQLDMDENTFEAGKHYTIEGDATDTAWFTDDANWEYKSSDGGYVTFEHISNETTVSIADSMMSWYTPPSSLMAPASMAAMEGAEGHSIAASQSEPLTGENTSSVLELATFTQSGMDTITLHDGQKLHIDAEGISALHEKGGVAMISGDETTEVVLESVTFFRTGNTVEMEGTQFEYCSFTAPDETEIQMLIQTTLLTGQAG